MKTGHTHLMIRAAAGLLLILLVSGCLPLDLDITLPRPPAGGTPDAPDGDDGLATTGGGPIVIGGSATAVLDDLYHAHNWTFEGEAGRDVVIEVVGDEDCDPRLKLLGPDGSITGENDDGGEGKNALLAITLPEDGAYTIRVDVFITGVYTVTVR